MKERFRQVPTSLQAQVFLRLGIGALSFFAGIFIWVYSRTASFALPCMLLSLILIVNGLILLYNCIVGNYIRLEGVCTDIEHTRFRKKVKAVTLEFDERYVYVQINRPFFKIKVGDNVTLLVSDKTPVYEKDGTYIIYSYLSLDKRSGKR